VLNHAQLDWKFLFTELYATVFQEDATGAVILEEKAASEEDAFSHAGEFTHRKKSMQDFFRVWIWVYPKV
jgi:hypothetical protein